MVASVGVALLHSISWLIPKVSLLTCGEYSEFSAQPAKKSMTLLTRNSYFKPNIGFANLSFVPSFTAMLITSPNS